MGRMGAGDAAGVVGGGVMPRFRCIRRAWPAGVRGQEQGDRGTASLRGWRVGRGASGDSRRSLVGGR
jgi:hypothetical protein